MFPVAAAALLRDTYGHDAVHVAEAGLRAAEDARVAAVARGEGRAVVTENAADFTDRSATSLLRPSATQPVRRCSRGLSRCPRQITMPWRSQWRTPRR